MAITEAGGGRSKPTTSTHRTAHPQKRAQSQIDVLGCSICNADTAAFQRVAPSGGGMGKIRGILGP